MAKVLFHFGAHKTASSHFQYNLNLNSDLLKEKGVIYHKIKFYNDTLGPNMIKFRDSHYKGKVLNELKDKIRAEINESIEGYDYALLSYEGVIGSMDISNSSKIYPHAEEIIKAYKEILSDHEVIPAYTTRNYDDFVISAYKWLIRRLKKTYKLSEFVDTVNLTPNRWTEILDSFYDNFGTTLVWTIEDYKTNAQNIIHKLVNEISETPIAMDELIFDEEKQNESNEKQSLNFFYAANKMDQRLRSIGIKRPKDMNRRIVINYFSKIKFLAPIIPNCMDIDVRKKFQTITDYKQEMEDLKTNPKFKVL